jgi:hypothetical protein
MPLHSDRRATLQSAKRGPPFGLLLESPSDSVTPLIRATSPSGAAFLAERLSRSNLDGAK